MNDIKILSESFLISFCWAKKSTNLYVLVIPRLIVSGNSPWELSAFFASLLRQKKPHGPQVLLREFWV